jgi:putative hydrolase
MHLEADLHIHTVASGHGYSTVDEIAQVASKRGLKLIAITDHGPALPGAAHPFYFWNLRVLPAEMYGVQVLKGAEVNIVNHQGDLDLTEDILEILDVVAVGFHPRCGYDGTTKEENTATLLKVMENPFVDIIVHPGNPLFPLDVPTVVEAAEEHGICLEMNNSSFYTRKGSYDTCLEIAKVAVKTNVKIVIGSDAHLATAVGQFSNVVELVEGVGLTEDRILNSSAQRVLDFLEQRKKKR